MKSWLVISVARCVATVAATAFALGACLHVTAQAPSQGLAPKVRALLSDRCFACHGPDSGNRQARLRFDVGGAFIDAEGAGEAAVVIAGQAAQSELLRRVLSQDRAEQMPPPESNLSLTEADKKLLKDWIVQGASWVEHWSFEPPRDVQPPANGYQDWGSNPIDRFVAARLKQQGLKPSLPASREILLRRVTFDLTGLPPTVAELDRFLADDTPKAYEHVVDRLLASPRFGERMAVPWLDAARYADTYGYQNDRFRRVWPWRDWVIQALNDNLPYDEFLTWQLAGDLLPNASREQRLATTFCRLHRETNEGGSLPEEFRAENVADRTNTLGAAVLGLTLECARCHDHKFDPVSQRDYYELFAYFNNTGELGLYSHFTDAVPTPAMDLPTDEQARHLETLEASIADAQRRLAKLGEESPRAGGAFFIEPVGEYGFEELGEGQNWVERPERIIGVRGKAILLDGEDGWQGPRHAFNRSQPFSLALWVRPSVSSQSAVIVHRSRAWMDACGRGYQLSLVDGRLAAALAHFWPGDAIQVVAEDPLRLNTWTHVAVTYDGSSRAAGLRLYFNGEAAAADVTHDSLTRSIRYVEGDIANDNDVRLTVGHRFRDVGFRGGAVDELCVYGTRLTALEVRMLAGLPVAEAAPDEQREHALARQSAEYAALADELERLRNKRDVVRDAIEQIPVMRDQATPGVTHLLERGAYNAHGEPVRPLPLDAIAADLPPGEPNRLGLARWLTHPRHPLTARVAVNRFWQTAFGRGLVTTANDFGSQGAPPTHPELMDWLAREFVDSGWDVKRLVRLMVTSATYQQDSAASLELLEIDPENELLARGPSGRLAAEMLRDAALSASGLLVEQIGGPPAHPFQPPGLWEEKGAAKYQRDAGAGSHRRSVYTIWKRTSPPPAMMTFDAADREVCVMRRQSTATPLQALVMLNDPQYVEAACGLAYRVRESTPHDLGERLARLFRIATSRRATDAELAVMLRLYDDQRAYYEQNPGEALELLSTGDLPAPDELHASENAALAAVALAVLNHDGAVMQR